MSLYLDYNASTPPDKRVTDFMLDIFINSYGNMSSNHWHGDKAYQALDYALKQVSGLLNCSRNEVIFTSGATESNNMALFGLKNYGINQNRKHIITSTIEHKSVLEPLNLLKNKGFEIELVQPEANGRINAADILNKVRPDTLLVSLMHVNNETGVIQPVAEIGRALASTKTYFHVDAAQSAGKLIYELQELDYDMLSLTAHKMYGPQGIGALVKKQASDIPLTPLLVGGGQQFGWRAGTLPTALIAGFGKACEIAVEDYAERNKAYIKNRLMVLDCLEKSGLEYEINGDPDFSIANTLNVSLKGIDSANLLKKGALHCSLTTGSACNCKAGLSHVLTAMGFEDERIRSALRFSWGHEPLDTDDITAFLKLASQLKL